VIKYPRAGTIEGKINVLTDAQVHIWEPTPAASVAVAATACSTTPAAAVFQG
jgi:hypothetical protein